MTEQTKLAQYQAERKARGTKEQLCRLINQPSITTETDGTKGISLRLWTGYNKETKTNSYAWAKANITPDQTNLLRFYESLEPGHLLSVEYFLKENDPTFHIYQIFKRQPKRKK